MEAPPRELVVGVLPYGFRMTLGFSRLPLARLDWPLGLPAELERGTVADLTATDHLIAYPSSTLYYAPRLGVKARLSIMIGEPLAVQGRHMRLIRFLHPLFHRVLTRNRDLLRAIPNGIFFQYGSTFIKDWTEVDRTKTKDLSIIASAQTSLEGHRLRHEVVAWLRDTGRDDVDVMGRGYRPFEQKEEGLAPYRYSVVIENVREPGHFTEKLVDCLLCDTVPIYWGTRDIGDFFDLDGIIPCEDIEDVRSAIAGIPEDDYHARCPAIARNRELAAGYVDSHGNAARAVLEDHQTNRRPR